MKAGRGLALLCLVVVGLCLAWYPPAIAIEDEAAYLAQARIFARGDLVGTEPLDRTISMQQTADGVAAKYPPGHPALLALSQKGPWRIAFAVPLAALILTCLLAAHALQRDGYASLWAALILLHPTLLLYSRTLMAELTAALVITAGFVWSDPRRPRPLLAGLMLGAVPVVRTALLPVALFLGGLLIWRLWRSGRRDAAVRAVAAALVPLVALGIYNLTVFDNPIETHAQVTGYFDLASAPARLLFYLVALNLVWPLLAVGVFLSKHERRLEARVISILCLALFGAYYFVDRRFGLPADLVVGLRFFAPVVPLLCIVYAEPLRRWLTLVKQRRAVAVAALGLVLAADALLVVRHQDYLEETARRRDLAVSAAKSADVVLAHGSAAELLSPAWGAPPFALVDSIDDLLQQAEDAASAGSRTVVVAQGAAADSLTQLTARPHQSIPGLTLVLLEPSATAPPP